MFAIDNNFLDINSSLNIKNEENKYDKIYITKENANLENETSKEKEKSNISKNIKNEQKKKNIENKDIQIN
ncbi:hypothetical protein U3516DRAFT_910891, partial [Neocallimastix sp. 'constans']